MHTRITFGDKPKLNPEIYEMAAQEIEARGWYKGNYISEDGRVCALGALSLACGGTVEYDWTDGEDSLWAPLYIRGTMGNPIYRMHHNALRSRVWNYYEETTVPRWNDYSGVTAGEVVGFLRDFANELREANE